jgi:Transmembrane protein 254
VFWFLLLDGGIVILANLALHRRAYDRAAELTGDALPPQQALQGLLVGTAVIHAVEALAAGRAAQRRGLSPRGWRLQTFVVGFPSLLALRRASRPA